jgi:hypothetical protein
MTILTESSIGLGFLQNGKGFEVSILFFNLDTNMVFISEDRLDMIQIDVLV